jgi:hypothetical protein
MQAYCQSTELRTDSQCKLKFFEMGQVRLLEQARYGEGVCRSRSDYLEKPTEKDKLERVGGSSTLAMMKRIRAQMEAEQQQSLLKPAQPPQPTLQHVRNHSKLALLKRTTKQHCRSKAAPLPRVSQLDHAQEFNDQLLFTHCNQTLKIQLKPTLRPRLPPP